MAAVMQPCDKAVIGSTRAAAPCSADAAPWILTATILGSSLVFIDGTVVNVALPALQAHLNATVVEVQWVVEAYALLLAALLLAGGSLGDIYGRRRMYLIGVLVFAVASAVCGVAASVYQLIAARALQGIGAAMLVPGSLAIISASFAERDRGRAIGTWSGFTAITAAIGPVLGGWLIEHASWRWIFFINLPLAAVVLIITLWKVPESRNAQASGRVDWVGAMLGTIGWGAVVFALVESSRRGWHDWFEIVVLSAGISSLIAFVVAELRISEPLLPLQLFRVRDFTGANLLTLFLYGGLSAMFFFFPMNLIQVQGYTATAAGAASLPFIILMFSLSRWSGGLVSRYGARRPLIFGPLIAAVGFALFAVPGIAGGYWTSFFPAVLVLGFGMTVTVAPLTTTVMNSVSQSRAGVASGINNAVSRLAAVLAIAVLGIVMFQSFDSHLTRDLNRIRLDSAARQQLYEQRIRLAAMEIPETADHQLHEAIRQSIHESFIAGFRMVMAISSGLALASSAVAWMVIRAERNRTTSA